MLLFWFIVSIGVSTPSQKHQASFFYYVVFLVTPPQKKKNQIFHWNPVILKFFILPTPSHLLKVANFLVKISQFKFLVMTEKSNFV